MAFKSVGTLPPEVAALAEFMAKENWKKTIQVAASPENGRRIESEDLLAMLKLVYNNLWPRSKKDVSWFFGQGQPSPSLSASEGDCYLDLITGDIYQFGTSESTVEPVDTKTPTPGSSTPGIIAFIPINQSRPAQQPGVISFT